MVGQYELDAEETEARQPDKAAEGTKVLLCCVRLCR